MIVIPRKGLGHSTFPLTFSPQNLIKERFTTISQLVPLALWEENSIKGG